MTNEHDEQCALMQWVRMMEQREPRLGLLYAIPNGAKLPYRKTASGVRYSPEAMRLKSEGLKPGCPDLALPVAKYGSDPAIPFSEILLYHGLFLELKSMSGVVRPEQAEFMEKLKEQGYRVEVCYGAEQAIAVLQDYLDLDRQTTFVPMGKPGKKVLVNA